MKEKLDNNSICILYILSNQQLVDVLAKGYLGRISTHVITSWVLLASTPQHEGSVENDCMKGICVIFIPFDNKKGICLFPFLSRLIIWPMNIPFIVFF